MDTLSRRDVVAQMQEFLDDPLHLAAAIDAITHMARGITLLRTDDFNAALAILSGYAMVSYTVTHDTGETAWETSMFEGTKLLGRQTFKERVDALQFAIEHGFRYVH